MKKAIEIKNIEALMKEAHAIKGGAANLIATPLSTAAAKLEHAAKSGNLDNLTILFEQVEKKFAALKKSTSKMIGDE